VVKQWHQQEADEAIRATQALMFRTGKEVFTLLDVIEQQN